ncbi:MAG: hypothetical protein DMD79_26585 [Candidatus Rokuibacteriota bacterium]|nr:MAG: hypothetical protein DMD79_26585 [Candidatus Rokubacteria bacterium]
MSLSELRGFAFDLDGCIWAGPTLLPGAADLVAALRAAGRRVVFVTNSSRERAASLAGRLSRLGIPTAPEDVLAAIELLGEAIRRRHGAVGVLALGTEEMGEVLEGAGHRIVSIERWADAQAVAVGNDPAFDFGRLRAAARPPSSPSTSIRGSPSRPASGIRDAAPSPKRSRWRGGRGRW